MNSFMNNKNSSKKNDTLIQNQMTLLASRTERKILTHCQAKT